MWIYEICEWAIKCICVSVPTICHNSNEANVYNLRSVQLFSSDLTASRLKFESSLQRMPTDQHYVNIDFVISRVEQPVGTHIFLILYEEKKSG